MVESVGVDVSMDGRGRWIDNRFIEKVETLGVRKINLRSGKINLRSGSRLFMTGGGGFGFAGNTPG